MRALDRDNTQKGRQEVREGGIVVDQLKVEYKLHPIHRKELQPLSQLHEQRHRQGSSTRLSLHPFLASQQEHVDLFLSLFQLNQHVSGVTQYLLLLLFRRICRCMGPQADELTRCVVHSEEEMDGCTLLRSVHLV